MQLSKFIARIIFTIAFISTFLAFFVTIVFQYNSFEKDKLHIKKEFIQLKKSEIKNEVDRVYEFIKYKQSLVNKSNSLHNQENEEKTKDDILDWISKIRFGKDGYIFVNSLDKKALVFDGKKIENPTLHPNIKLFNQQLDTVKNENEGFFFYNFKKLDTSKEFAKLGFVKKHDKYNWIIGSGVYLDEIDNEIIRKEKIFKNTILNEINFFILILIFISIGIYFVSKKVSKYINQNITNLIFAFEKASKRNKSINTSALTYSEFISLANKLNITLENKNKTEAKLQDYIKIVNEHVMITSTDEKGIIKDISEAFCKISGYTKEELIGEHYNILRNENIPESFYENLCSNLKINKNWKGELKNKNKQGQVYWVEAIIQANIENGDFKGYTTIRTDITNKKKVEHLSITDDLTQLYNRRYFNKIIDKELNRKKREKAFISFMMIDIDYFKRYNDTYGHQAGDKALQIISAIFRISAKRSGDFVFRLGGEEFAMIFYAENFDNAYDFASKIKKEIEDLEIEHSTSEISKFITTSIGLIHKPACDITNSAELYKIADEALYRAKNSGRNCIYVEK